MKSLFEKVYVKRIKSEFKKKNSNKTVTLKFNSLTDLKSLILSN